MRPALYLVAAALVFAISGTPQSGEQQLKARELFYTPPPKAAVKPPAVKPPNVKPPKKTTVEVVVQKPPSQDPPVQVVPAAYSPLGLKYSLLKKAGDRFLEVDADTEFHSGDRIRVRVEANDSAYLYIVMGGTSGTWQVLFPSAEISNGNNLVEKGRSYTIPPENQGPFVFDDTAGTERISLVLCREPERDLEKLIYTAVNQSHTLVAQAPKIDDAVMGQVHEQMVSRDLVFEKVDTEKAVYAATPDQTSQARVFVDLQLKHR